MDEAAARAQRAEHQVSCTRLVPINGEPIAAPASTVGATSDLFTSTAEIKVRLTLTKVANRSWLSRR